MASLANTWRLSSVERASMTEQVLRELREAIIEGRIPQGEALREVSLAGTLGTGRSAVPGGHPPAHPGGPRRVRAPPRRVRAGDVARRPARRLRRPRGDRGRRDALHPGRGPRPTCRTSARRWTTLRAAAADADHVTDPMIDADIRFHQELVRPGRKPTADARPRDARGRDRGCSSATTRDYPRSTYVTDHDRLLEAFERRDPATPDLVADHLRLSKDLIASELAHEGEEPPMQQTPSRPDRPEAPRVSQVESSSRIGLGHPDAVARLAGRLRGGASRFPATRPPRSSARRPRPTASRRCASSCTSTTRW